MNKLTMTCFLTCLFTAMVHASNTELSEPVKLEKIKLGNEGSHGGDPTLNDYIAVQREAVKVLRKIDVSWLGGIEQRYREFFLAFNSNNEMANDLENSPVDLREKNANSKCGYTSPSPKAPIWISRQLCPKFNSVNFSTRITTMFIGEAAHHFGADDTFASGFAVAIYNAYLRGAPVIGKWSNVSNDQEKEKIEFYIASSDTYKDGLAVSLKTSSHFERFNIPTWTLKSKSWDKMDGSISLKGSFSYRFADNTTIENLPFTFKMSLAADGQSLKVWLFKPTRVFKNATYRGYDVAQGPFVLNKVDKLSFENNNLPVEPMSSIATAGYYKGASRYYGFNLEVFEDSRELLLTFPESGTIILLKCGSYNYCSDKEGHAAMVFPEGVLLRWPGKNEGVMYFKDGVESFSEPYFASPKACDMKLLPTFNQKYAVLFFHCPNNTSGHYRGSFLQYYENDNIWKLVGQNITLKFLKDGRFIYVHGATTYLMSEKK